MTNYYRADRFLIAAIVVVIAILLMGCPDDDDIRDSNNFPQTEDTTYQPSISGTSLKSVADSALLEFSKLAIIINDPRLGFSNAIVVSRAMLGTSSNEPPIPVHIVSLSSMRAYTDTMVTDRFIGPVRQFIYPVMVDDTACSCILVEYANNLYRVVGYGGRNITTDLIRKRHDLESRFPGVSRDSLFLVKIPSLNVYLMGGRGGTGIQLSTVYTVNTALLDTTGFGPPPVVRDSLLPAKTILRSLVRGARDHNGGPR
jgi:hypothetical protein